MPRGPLPFKKTDVKRAIQIAHEAGLQVTGIAPDGTVLTNDKGDAPRLDNGGDERNPWDEAYGKEIFEAHQRSPKNQR
jgi:hypothetical protein